MSKPFRLLGLPAEIQVSIFSFYFESPFDIQICRLSIRNDEHGQVKWSGDSRSKFCALWTSPDILTQVRRAYLAGFSGYVDLRYLGGGAVPDDRCRSAVYKSVLRTIPKSRVRVLDLGHRHRCHCREGDVSETSGDDSLGSSCQTTFQMSRQFPKLEKICITFMQKKVLCHGAVALNQLLDGSLDSRFIKSASNQLRRRRLNYGQAVILSRSGGEAVIEITFYHTIRGVVTGELDDALRHSYIVYKFHARNWKDMVVVSREILSSQPHRPCKIVTIPCTVPGTQKVFRL